VIDVRDPENLNPLAFAETPTGHTTPASTTAGGCGRAGRPPGRPIFVTDMRDPHHPKVNPNPIDTARNDGRTYYAHDVQVDEAGVAWVSGRGGVRGCWT
jgi:hypothetical protein